MKRALVVLALLVATSAHAADKWFDHYKKGVAAVNGRSYKLGVDLLQKSVAEMPNEGTGVRAGKEIIVYVPHFWLGIAKFNNGDVDGALREWRTSEEQGVIARTEYYSKLKDWVARAQTEKQRVAQDVASGPKKAADTAISRALAMQVDALSAGGDRSESYRAAQRKLQDALNQFHKAGTDIDDYKAAEQIAQQASSLFATAAEEGKKLKAQRAAAPVVKQQQPAPKPAVVAPPPVAKVDTAPPAVPVESEAEVAAKLAVQQYRRNVGEAPRAIERAESSDAERLRRELELAKSDADFDRIAREAKDRDAAMAQKIAALKAPPPPPPPTDTVGVVSVTTPQTGPDLRDAYRAYAQGDLSGAEQLLTKIVETRATAEAYLLRGCARYTRAMLSRTPKPALDAATDDFRKALQRNRALRLDRRAFSPKLVAFFEQVRSSSTF